MHRNSLIQPITDQEIWTTLKGFGDIKAHGIDGYNDKLSETT